MTSDNLGSTIRQARKKARLTLAALGWEVGAADGTIWRIEHDVYVPSVTLVVALAYTLGLDKTELRKLRDEAEARKVADEDAAA